MTKHNFMLGDQQQTHMHNFSFHCDIIINCPLTLLSHGYLFMVRSYFAKRNMNYCLIGKRFYGVKISKNCVGNLGGRP